MSSVNLLQVLSIVKAAQGAQLNQMHQQQMEAQQYVDQMEADRQMQQQMEQEEIHEAREAKKQQYLQATKSVKHLPWSYKVGKYDRDQQIAKVLYPFVEEIVPPFRTEWIVYLITSLKREHLYQVLTSYSTLCYRAREANSMIWKMNRHYKAQIAWVLEKHQFVEPKGYQFIVKDFDDQEDRPKEDKHIRRDVKKAINYWLKELIPT